MTAQGGEAVGKPGVAGVDTNQRLSLSKPWEGLRMICQGLEPDPGDLAVRDFRGASVNVRHGEIVTPSRNRKSGNGNPSPTSEARPISIPTTGASTRCTAGVWGPASKERFSEITSGSCRGQQGLVTTCKDSPNEAKPKEERAQRERRMSQ